MFLTIIVLTIICLLILTEILPEKESLDREKLRLDKMAYVELRKNRWTSQN